MGLEDRPVDESTRKRVAALYADDEESDDTKEINRLKEALQEVIYSDDIDAAIGIARRALGHGWGVMSYTYGKRSSNGNR